MLYCVCILNIVLVPSVQQPNTRHSCEMAWRTSRVASIRAKQGEFYKSSTPCEIIKLTYEFYKMFEFTESSSLPEMWRPLKSCAICRASARTRVSHTRIRPAEWTWALRWALNGEPFRCWSANIPTTRSCLTNSRPKSTVWLLHSSFNKTSLIAKYHFSKIIAFILFFWRRANCRLVFGIQHRSLLRSVKRVNFHMGLSNILIHLANRESV